MANKKAADLPVIGLDFGNVYSYPSVMQDGRIIDLLPMELKYGIPSTFTIYKGEDIVCFDPLVQQTFVNVNPEAVLFKRKYARGDNMVRFGAASAMLSDIIKKIVAYVMNVANKRLDILAMQRTYRIALSCPETYSPGTRIKFRELIEEIDIDIGNGQTHKAELVGMISEPEAAALDYLQNENIQKRTTVMVFDLGGGTFDATVLEADPNGIFVNGVYTFSTPVDHDGIEDIGGQDFTDRMRILIREKVKEQNPEIKIIENSTYNAAEYAKRELSYRDTTEVASLYSAFDSVDPVTITAQEFSDICMGQGPYAGALGNVRPEKRNLMTKLMETTSRLYNYARNNGHPIDKIIMVGGASQMPIVQNALRELFHNELERDSEFIKFHEASKAISHGMARYAHFVESEASGNPTGTPKGGKVIIPKTRRDLALYVYHEDNVLHMTQLVAAGTPLPCEVTRNLYTHSGGGSVNNSLYEAHDTNPPDDVNAYDEIIEFTYVFNKTVPKGTLNTTRLRIDENGFITMTIDAGENGAEQAMEHQIMTHQSS